MSTDTEVRVVVPMGELDWLEEELVPFADAEGPEEEGDVQVYYVTDKSTSEVQAVLDNLLTKNGTAGEYEVVLDEECGDLVIKPLKVAQWLKYPLGAQSSYERALKRYCKKVAEDPQWASWWQQTPFSTLYFHVSAETHEWMFIKPEAEDTTSLLVEARFPEKDLNIMDIGKPDRKVVNAMVERHLAEILRRTGEWLRLPAPEWRSL